MNTDIHEDLLIAQRDTLDMVDYRISQTELNISDTQGKMSRLEASVYDIRNALLEIEDRITAGLIESIVEKYKDYSENKDFTGMTDEDFNTEIKRLLFGGVMY